MEQIDGKRMEELWEIVDIKGNVIGTMTPGVDRVPDGYYHKAVEMVVTNGKDMLITQRDMRKHRGAGEWEFPAGSVMSGESTLDAAMRELREETGLETVPTQYEQLCTNYMPGMIRTTYIVKMPDLWQREILLQPGETMDYRFVNFREWLQMITYRKFDRERTHLYSRKFQIELAKAVGENPEEALSEQAGTIRVCKPIHKKERS